MESSNASSGIHKSWALRGREFLRPVDGFADGDIWRGEGLLGLGGLGFGGGGAGGEFWFLFLGGKEDIVRRVEKGIFLDRWVAESHRRDVFC